MHPPAPAPFNQDFRPGLSLAIQTAHYKWCDENPNATKEERAAAYKATYNRLLPDFPSIREGAKYP